MASPHESGFFPANEKVPVQCLDDPFGFNAVVVYEDKSVRLNRCTPFLTIPGTQQTAYERPAAEAENIPESRNMLDTSSTDNRGRPNATSRPVRTPMLDTDLDTDAQNTLNNLIFTDGGSPLTMATGGMGNYNPWQMESHVLLEEDEWDKHPKTRMKKAGKRGGRRSRRKQRT